jgi:hypothetical protein
MNDAKQIFSDEQTVALNAGVSALSTNVISLATGKNYKNFQTSNTKYADPSDAGITRILVQVMGELLEAAVDGATLTIGLYTHSTATVNSGTLIDSKVVTVNTAGTGATAIGTVLWDFGVPNEVLAATKYFGLYYTVATQNISTGKVFAAIVPGVQNTSDE